MSQFSKRAPWLNLLFPQSVAPQVRDPSVVSDDVSLIQPYDGGGYALGSEIPWHRFLISGPGPAAGVGNIFFVPEGELFRFLAADITLVGGVAGSAAIAVGQVSPATPGETKVTDQIIPVGDARSMTVKTPIVAPLSNITVQWTNGDAATSYLVRIYGISVPLGTVFYV